MYLSQNVGTNVEIQKWHTERKPGANHGLMPAGESLYFVVFDYVTGQLLPDAGVVTHGRRPQ